MTIFTSIVEKNKGLSRCWWISVGLTLACAHHAESKEEQTDCRAERRSDKKSSAVKRKEGQSVNTDTSVTVEKSPEVDHVVGNTKHCPESGTVQNFTEHNDIPQMIVSYNNGLGLNVSQELKNKIINGQYIDLAKMFVNSNEPQKQSLVMVNGELQATEKNAKNITNIQQWTDAFIIFASIYLEGHPTKALDLLKYMNDVRLAAARSSGLGFKEYDQQFRLKLAKNPSGAWGTVDPELWLIYITPISRSFLAADTQNQSQNSKCYTYNFQGSCFKAPCSYLHQCMKCNAQHPLAICPKK